MLLRDLPLLALHRPPLPFLSTLQESGGQPSLFAIMQALQAAAPFPGVEATSCALPGEGVGRWEKFVFYPLKDRIPCFSAFSSTSSTIPGGGGYLEYKKETCLDVFYSPWSQPPVPGRSERSVLAQRVPQLRCASYRRAGALLVPSGILSGTGRQPVSPLQALGRPRGAEAKHRPLFSTLFPSAHFPAPGAELSFC